MSTNTRESTGVEKHLQEIRQLEEQVAKLKRELLQGSASIIKFGSGSVSFLIVVAQDRLFAIPVDHVEEVFEMVAVSELTQPHPSVLGLLDYHGTLTVLFDLGILAGMGKTPINTDNVVVMCRIQDYRFAVMGSETSDVITVDAEDISTGDDIISGVLKEVGVVRTENGTAPIIDFWSALLAVQTSIPEGEIGAAPSDSPDRSESER